MIRVVLDTERWGSTMTAAVDGEYQNWYHTLWVLA
jgi:hypothetical protein